jgi:hypothetical protein
MWLTRVFSAILPRLLCAAPANQGFRYARCFPEPRPLGLVLLHGSGLLGGSSRSAGRNSHFFPLPTRPPVPAVG